jgi:FAD/FMN-containing dehydrogenase
LDFVVAHFDAREVLSSKHLWYVLLELSSRSREGLAARLLALLEAANEKHIVEDAAVAASLDQREYFWKLRELLPDAQRHEGGSIKHDVSVPIADIPVFLEEVERAVTSSMPGARLVAFGHLGDGNIHCNVSQPIGANRQAFLARWDEISAIVHGLVIERKGSISAEHGIGQLKRDLLPKVKDKVAMEMMRAIKQALDPKNILNPGKVL